jgi:hypothetical protein
MTGYIDTVAPTPHWGDENITMDALIKARLANAQRLFEFFHDRSSAAFRFEPGDKSQEALYARSRMMVSLLEHLLTSVEASLLMTIQELAPDIADEYATGHVGKGESGDYYPEMIWEWLEERGIDPELVRAEAKSEIAAEEAGS